MFGLVVSLVLLWVSSVVVPVGVVEGALSRKSASPGRSESGFVGIQPTRAQTNTRLRTLEAPQPPPL